MSKLFQAYGIGQPLIPVLPPPVGFTTAPNSNQNNYEIGQIAYTPLKNATSFYIYAGGGVWDLLDTGSAFAETYDCDTGSATPAAFVLNVIGGSGISTSGSGNTITISQKNSVTNTAVTVGVTSANLNTFTLTAPGVYFFTTQLAGYSSGADPNNEGLGSESFTTIVFDGTTSRIIDNTDSIAQYSPGYLAAATKPTWTMTSAGATVNFQVTGATAFTIDWAGITNYIYRG